jgi:hypothetical protein
MAISKLGSPPTGITAGPLIARGGYENRSLASRYSLRSPPIKRPEPLLGFTIRGTVTDRRLIIGAFQPPAHIRVDLGNPDRYDGGGPAPIMDAIEVLTALGAADRQRVLGQRRDGRHSF